MPENPTAPHLHRNESPLQVRGEIHRDPSEPAPPERSIKTLSIEDALLLSPLRRLYAEWRAEAAATKSEELRAAYQRAMDDLERVIRHHDERQQAWTTLKRELATVLGEVLAERDRTFAERLLR